MILCNRCKHSGVCYLEKFIWDKVYWKVELGYCEKFEERG